VIVPTEKLLAGGQAALRSGDAAGARRALEQVPVESSGDVIEALARTSYIELDFATAIAQWERAYAAHRRSGDHVGAIRVARTLAGTYGAVFGTGPCRAAGWLERRRC
jgi:hypothetical protein